MPHIALLLYENPLPRSAVTPSPQKWFGIYLLINRTEKWRLPLTLVWTVSWLPLASQVLTWIRRCSSLWKHHHCAFMETLDKKEGALPSGGQTKWTMYPALTSSSSDMKASVRFSKSQGLESQRVRSLRERHWVWEFSLGFIWLWATIPGPTIPGTGGPLWNNGGGSLQLALQTPLHRLEGDSRKPYANVST